MKSISLREFILSGFLDQITTGVTTEKIAEILGNPEYVYDADDCGIIYYGTYEFHYWTNTKTVYLIQNVHLSDETIYFENNSFKIDPWFLKIGKEFTFKEVKSILESENLKYIVDHENDIIKFESGVFLDFISGYKGYGGNDKNVANWKSINISIENTDEYILHGIRKQ
jgi:hypothetical protein